MIDSFIIVSSFLNNIKFVFLSKSNHQATQIYILRSKMKSMTFRLRIIFLECAPYRVFGGPSARKIW